MTSEDPEAQQDTAAIEAAFRRILVAKEQAGNVKTAKKALSDLRAAVGSLSNEDFRILMAEDEMQAILHTAAVTSGELRPGDPVFDEKGRELYRAPYSYDWVEQNMPMVTWTVPPEPFGRRYWEAVSWNGVDCPVPLPGGETVTTPECFKSIVEQAYADITRALRSQSNVLATVGSRAADGVSVEGGGFFKPTPEELVASGEWRDTSRR